MIARSFGSFIKLEREKRIWTQTELGAKIGINCSAVSRIENGTKRLTVSKIRLLSEIFEIDLQILNDLFYADKFAREAQKNKCSDRVFIVAGETAIYLKENNNK